MKQFIGTCVENPFHSLRELESVIDKGVPITKGCFLNRCDVPLDIQDMMRQFPHDFEYYQSNGGIAFYTWSAIEHFYK